MFYGANEANGTPDFNEERLSSGEKFFSEL
jgi:hypothetical protein